MADFDWGNLLYLLALVLFAVFGGRKKKKRSPVGVPNSENLERENSKPSILEEFLGKDFLGTEKEEAFSDPYEPLSVEVPDHEPVPQPKEIFKPSYNAQQSNLFTDEGEPSTENHSSAPPSSTPTIHPVIEALNEPFDIRRAVIYSEILNRKSF